MNKCRRRIQVNNDTTITSLRWIVVSLFLILSTAAGAAVDGSMDVSIKGWQAAGIDEGHHHYHHLINDCSDVMTETADTDRSNEPDYRLDNESYTSHSNGNTNPQQSVKDTSSWFFRIQQFFDSSIKPIYVHNLQHYPTLTKSLTACFIGGLGDILAQWFEASGAVDIRRLLSVAGEGLLVSGPLMHYSYEFLDTIIPVEHPGNTPLQKWLLAGIQVLVDCLVMDCVFVATLMLTTALLEGRHLRHALGEFSSGQYWAGVRVSWASSACFAPLQTWLFRYVPLEFRVMAMNVQDVFWNAAISYIAHQSRKEPVVGGKVTKLE